MMRLRTLATSVACAAVSMAVAASAQAGAPTETWNFYDCSGPSGTPASFSATRTSGAVGNSLHVGGGGTFEVIYSYNEDLGVYNVPTIAPGMVQAAAVQCSTIGPRLGFHLTVWGRFAP